ncbi:hypothetical protein [Actinocrispum wychmicini]|uniref:SurA-like protein n=1 Tax=Actinocrispum wychmicini TaxID=1213861 RepID=A0A4R2JMS3_9PSEU|nr:hypothetical protein [Actinocrispum wychmicini]TCO58426.1 hypothetical protein EV192_105495 [Actinocrispum wychmicini]
MTTAMRRSVVLIAAATTLVAGCSTGQGDPSVAVAVGGVNLATVDQVQQQLSDLLTNNQQAQDMAKQRQLDQVARGIVTQDVLHVLTAEAAKQQNVTVDESLVTQLAPILTAPPQQQQGTDADPAAQTTAVVNAAFPATDVARDKVIQMQLGRKSVGTVSVTADVAILSDQNEARSLANRIAQSPDKAVPLIQSAKSMVQDPFVDRRFGYRASDKQHDPANQIVGVAAQPFMYVPAGSVLMWRLTGEQGGYAVIYIKDRQTGPAPADLDLSQVNPLQFVDVGKFSLVPLALQRGVKPNQRYGEWDMVNMQVISASEAATGSFVIAPANPKQ